MSLNTLLLLEVSGNKFIVEVRMCVHTTPCTTCVYVHVYALLHPPSPGGEHTLEVLVKLFDLALRGDHGCHDKLLRAIHMQTAHLLQ